MGVRLAIWMVIGLLMLAPGRTAAPVSLPADVVVVAATPVAEAEPVAAVPSPEPAPVSDVQIIVPQPLLIHSRILWEGLPVRDERMQPLGEAWRITVHHTGADGHAELPGDVLLRRIEGDHISNRGWGAVGYHFLVSADGQVWEGRPLCWQGAHAQGSNNQGNIGIALAGHFHEQEPSQVQMDALIALLESLCAEHAIPAWEVHGHRDFCHTNCPGDALLAAIANWRREASHAMLSRIQLAP